MNEIPAIHVVLSKEKHSAPWPEGRFDFPKDKKYMNLKNLNGTVTCKMRYYAPGNRLGNAIVTGENFIQIAPEYEKFDFFSVVSEFNSEDEIVEFDVFFS